jgi:hypothetical protein
MDEQQTPIAGTPIYQESQEKNAKWLWLLIVLIIVGALVFAFFRGIGPFSRFKAEVREEASPTPVVFFSPSPTPEGTRGAELDKSEPKIRVLNGSGKSGVASSVKDFLEGKGYKVVAIGNAPSYDFENTVLRFKEGFEKFQEVLTGDLEDKYSVTTSSEALEATDSADIEVIAGAK